MIETSVGSLTCSSAVGTGLVSWIRKLSNFSENSTAETADVITVISDKTIDKGEIFSGVSNSVATTGAVSGYTSVGSSLKLEGWPFKGLIPTDP